MKLFRLIALPFQIIIICLWTIFSGIIGMILLLLTRNQEWTHRTTAGKIWAPVLCLVTGVRVRLEGKEHIDNSKACIYVANHTSQFDIVALSVAMPVALFFVAKKELAKVPIVGQYIYLLGHIFIDRKNSEAARESMKKAAEKVKAGKNVISFAEGTRSKTGDLLLFKRGAFILAKEGNIDVVPVAITGSFDVLPSGSFMPKPGIITVKIGKHIRYEEYREMSTEELAAHTREKVKELIVA